MESWRRTRVVKSSTRRATGEGSSTVEVHLMKPARIFLAPNVGPHPEGFAPSSRQHGNCFAAGFYRFLGIIQ